MLTLDCQFSNHVRTPAPPALLVLLTIWKGTDTSSSWSTADSKKHSPEAAFLLIPARRLGKYTCRTLKCSIDPFVVRIKMFGSSEIGTRIDRESRSKDAGEKGSTLRSRSLAIVHECSATRLEYRYVCFWVVHDNDNSCIRHRRRWLQHLLCKLIEPFVQTSENSKVTNRGPTIVSCCTGISVLYFADVSALRYSIRRPITHLSSTISNRRPRKTQKRLLQQLCSVLYFIRALPTLAATSSHLSTTHHDPSVRIPPIVHNSTAPWL